MNSELFTPDAARLAIQALEELPERRAWLKSVFYQRHKPTTQEDVYGRQAVVRLADGLPGAAQVLCDVARWFEREHPLGRDPKGEPDFAALPLCWALAAYQDRLGEAEEEIRRFFLTHDFESKYYSENHMLLFHGARYVAAGCMPGERFCAYDSTGEELLHWEHAYLSKFIAYRIRHGWAEFDAPGYAAEVISALLTIRQFAVHEDIRKLSEAALDILLAELVCDSSPEGFAGGAHGRMYNPDSLSHTEEGTLPILYLYLGGGAKDFIRHSVVFSALLSDYVPPAAVRELLQGRTGCYESRKAFHLHMYNLCQQPGDEKFEHVHGYINKYTYHTPEYMVGAVNWQDEYDPDLPDRWYAHHQQREWDFSIHGAPNARIFTHHPGKSGSDGMAHGYWTGDLGCCCSQFFSQRNVVLGMHDIPSGQLYQGIHAYLPKAEFDEIREREGWVFARRGGVYAGLYLTNGYIWTIEGEYAMRELFSVGARGASLFVCGSEREYADFDAFIAWAQAAELSFDREQMVLRYKNGAQQLTMTRNKRYIGLQRVSFPYPTFDSPYLQGNAQGELTLVGASQTLRYDVEALLGR